MDYLLHHLLQRAAEAEPERIALIDGARALSYAELHARSNQLAQLLVERGVSRGDRVGLYLDKSAESIISVYGVLKAGAVYVPFDPQAPVARLSYIARNCEIRCLLTGREKAGTWTELAERAQVSTFVVLNAGREDLRALPPGATSLDSAALEAQPTEQPQTATISQDLAYILYTSGSTGEPKGVMLTHRNALAFVHWAVDEFGVRADDRLSNHAPLHFDLSVFDIFAAAAATATLDLVPPKIALFPIEVARFIDAHEITVWYSVPSVLTRLTEQANLPCGAFPRLRTILFAGEVFPTKFLRRLMALLPLVRFCNLYGPTETNVCTWYDVPPLPEAQTEPIPIGKAIADVEVFAVTEEGKRAQRGEVGELYVRGPTVMQGYWGDRERTNRSLFPHPFGGELHDPVYKTGDLVREDDEGNYRFLGRRDAQIKSRGYRIELGEIEAALYANPALVECAVVAIPDEVITNRLVACVVVRGHVEESALIRSCAERIPRYMIPETFEFWDTLPKTSTGKVDRQTLTKEVMAGTRHAALAGHG